MTARQKQSAKNAIRKALRPVSIAGIALVFGWGAYSLLKEDPVSASDTIAQAEADTIDLQETERLADAGITGPDDNSLPTGPVAPPEIWPKLNHQIVKIQSGDTLAQILDRAHVDRQQAFEVITALKQHFKPRYLQVGQEISLETVRMDAEQQAPVLTNLSMEADILSRLVVDRTEQGLFESRIEEIPAARVTVHAGGTISDSLFLSAQRQGLPAAVIVELIRIFSFDVDFQREIREGDSFQVYFDRIVSEDGSRMKQGDILFASLTLSGKQIDLYRYSPDQGEQPDYFHADGQSVKKTLMKTPVDGARLSSRFGARKHPILGYTRMHKGVDFAASRGTPVMAAGDGVVERASRYGGYGNYIKIRHNDSYTTAYAHLNGYARGIKAGKRVKQGQIIGYVGTTGRSTGPHLHYEVFYNGKQTNPLALKIPTGQKLKGPTLTAFQTYVQGLDQEVAAIPLTVVMAQN